jgi:uncharacterized membrane protein
VEVLHYVSLTIGIVGIVIICWGVLLGLLDFIHIEFDHLRGTNIRNRRYLLRHNLGSYLLLGLEFLIAADVVRTIINPTLMELAILGSIIAIRTAISFFLNMEMGHPHYRADEEKKD